MAPKNTVTLLPLMKAELSEDEQEFKKQLDVILKTRTGGVDYRETTIVPVGLSLDASGLIRGTTLGLYMVSLSRQIGKKEEVDKDQAFKDQIQVEMLEVFKNVCDPKQLENVNISPDDIINLCLINVVDINDLISSLVKIIKLIPIEPIDIEQAREMFENVCKIEFSA